MAGRLECGGRGALLAVVLVAGSLGGCASTGAGGSGLASVSLPGFGGAPAAAPAAVEPIPIPVNYGAFLGGPVGTRLAEADRTAALEAENAALSSGQRHSWKGANGVFGYVVPGPSASAGTAIPADGAPAECRSFTATVFFAGRPQTGKGTGCRDLDGNWHVTS